MFDFITVSKIDGNGQEFFSAWIDFKLDEIGTCNGCSIALCSDHQKETFEIHKSFWQRGSLQYIETLKQGKGETWCLSEFQKWLTENRYTESKAYVEYQGKILNGNSKIQ